MHGSIGSGGDDIGSLREVAREVLNAFGAISAAARTDLDRRGVTLGDLAAVNQATAETTARRMQEMNDQRMDDGQRLTREPAIARLVIADEDDEQQTIYISSSGTVKQEAVQLCSYMSPKGQLAALNVGDYRQINMPGGRRAFEIVEKVTFKPIDLSGAWDAKPAIQFRDRRAPLSIQSLRDLLRQDGVEAEVIDAVAAWLKDDDVTGNVSEGIRRAALSAMELRIAPILNEFQDRIFRLPIDSRIAVLGPPGTGKTTTLIKRLRQKVDFAYLDAESELPLVEENDATGLSHADNWIMFTPTELLRLYVKEAFGKEGVPVHDDRIRTWDDHRRAIGRGGLRILRSGSGSGLVLRNDDALLARPTLGDQIAWFQEFDVFQQGAFVDQLAAEAARLLAAADPQASALGRQVGQAIDRSGHKPLLLLGELAAFWKRLRDVADARRDETRPALQEPLNRFATQRPGFLDSLTFFVDELDDDGSEEEDDDAVESEDDEASARSNGLRGARLAREVFTAAMRNRAIAQASGRTPAIGTRAGRLLAWLEREGFVLPDLRSTGAALLVQRAALRLARAPNSYLTGIPLRYRRFRRAMREQEKWYGVRTGASDAHPAEIDLIMLALLRAGRAMEEDRLLTSRSADRRPAMLDEIVRLRRAQVMVDEATDFSPIQLACMRELANSRVGSFFLSGDYNQRLTHWGSRSDDQLRWVAPDIQVERIDISYRQSRKLADFARALAGSQGWRVEDTAPEHIDNQGWDPVVGRTLSTISDEARWLAARIREIGRLTGDTLPTIAVLVADPATLDPLAEALSEALEDLNVPAVACPKGMVKGQAGDVRIFEVEHIKGLEFEAVFFMDLDGLKRREPALFERYLYVGATRAATFLGLAYRGIEPPALLLQPDLALVDRW